LLRTGPPRSAFLAVVVEIPAAAARSRRRSGPRTRRGVLVEEDGRR
jgi:hypothetical protein